MKGIGVMQHFKTFQDRTVRALDISERDSWRLKRYAIIAAHREYDTGGVMAATDAAFARLPKAGTLQDAQSNHGIGFQIIHFAEDIPLVSPVFYWTWGSVLFNAHQMRSYRQAPYEIVDGVRDVVGCIWEMQLVAFEVRAWRDTVLSGHGEAETNVAKYLTMQSRE